MSQLTFGESFHKETDGKSWYSGRTLSHSSVSTYQQCPQKWKFRYVDKIPEKPRSYFSFGKSVHSGLEYLFLNLHQDAFPPLERVLDSFQKSWLSEGYDTPQQERWFFKEGERILRGFYAKHRKDFQRVLEVEYKFSISVEGVPVMGFIDRVDRTESGNLSIVDYKTGKAFDKSRVRQDPQLTLYQIACRQLFGKDVEKLTLYHLNSLTPVSVDAHSAQLETSLKESIVSAAKGIMEKKFDPKPAPAGYCQWCDYLQVCPAFGPDGSAGPLRPSLEGDLAEKIDRYGKLADKIGQLTEEKNRLESELVSRLNRKGRTEQSGRHYTVRVDDKDHLRSDPKVPD